MKYTLAVALSVFSWLSCFGQELVAIRDTVNHFEIGVPAGWRYGVPADKSLALIAISQKQNEQDVPRENYNLNILRLNNTDLNTSYAEYLKSVGSAEGFKILEQGEQIIQGRKYKYLKETHKNKASKEDMSNYVLFANKEGEILILTMVTTTERFARFKDLFDSIAQSLKY